MFEAEACGEQAALVGLTDLTEITDGGPEFLRAHVEILDGLEQIAHDPLYDLLESLVTARLVEPGELVHQIGDRTGLQ